MTASYGPPLIDFTPLANLGKTFSDARDSARKRGLEEERRDALRNLPAGADGMPSLSQLGRVLLQTGDVQGAMAAATLANSQTDREFDRQYKTATLGLAVDSAKQKDRPAIGKIYNEEGREQTALIDARAGTATPLGGAKQAEPKPLPHSTVKELSEAGAGFADYQRLLGGFKDDYAGYVVRAAGDAANWAGRTIPGVTDERRQQAEWWQDYQAKRNVVRNALFGAALTKIEGTEFDKADIHPGMSPQAVRTNLTRQNEIAKRAAQKLANYYVRTGRNPAEIEAALGVPLDQLGIKAGRPARPGSAVAPGTPKGDAAARFRQLRSDGMDEDQAYRALAEEGY